MSETSRTALIIGAGGVGQALAAQLKAGGFTVHLAGRTTDAADTLGVGGLAADLADPADVRALALTVAQASPAVDLLVVATGDMLGAPIAETSAHDLDRILANNVRPVHLALSQLTPLLGPDGYRLILGAYTERLHLPRLAAYAAAKAAVDALVRVALKEQRAVKTALARLPAIRTPMWNKAPFPVPAGALSAEDAARALLGLYREGKTGVIDL